MLLRSQVILFAAALVVSLFVTKTGSESAAPEPRAEEQVTSTVTGQSAELSFPTVLPARRWNVPDPELSAQAAIVHSLDDDMPLYHKHLKEPRPLASLTKLLTAVAVEEDIGVGKHIPITQEAVATEGVAGDLVSGESYLAKDLLSVMLLTSSNDAAAAFEEYAGGTERFAALLNEKAVQLGLADTVVYDGSGLNDANTGTAQDMLQLAEYILKNRAGIIYGTQSPKLTVEPLNSAAAKHVYNIDPLVETPGFLGGKTGTSPQAGENLVALFTKENRRLLIVLLGSRNREADTETLLDWVGRAYEFPAGGK